MASDLISREAVLNIVDNEWYKYKDKDGLFEIAACTLMKSLFDDVERIEAVDAIQIDAVAEMLADLFGEECCCDYNGIDEWLPMLCEYSDTCPETIGKNGCWKQFIKHWEERKKDAQETTL